MLKRLAKVSGNIYRWKIALHLPTRRVHTHVELTEEAAHKVYAELLEERSRIALGLAPATPGQHVSLDSAANAYERHIVAAGKSAEHIVAVMRSLNLLRTVCDAQAPLGRVTPAAISAWMEKRAGIVERGRLPKNRTVNKGRAHLSAFFAWCVKPQGWLQFNPVDAVPKYKEPPPPEKHLAFTSYKKFSAAAWKYRPALALLIEVVAETGARINEVCRALVPSVDVDSHTWAKIVKGGVRRAVVAAGPWTTKAAQDATNKAGPLCPREDGGHFRYHVVLRAFDMICQQAEITRVTPHYLRHARATWDADDGVPVVAVQRQLAHTNIKTTQRYFAKAEAKDLLAHKRTKIIKLPKSCALMCKKQPQTTQKRATSRSRKARKS